MKLVKRRKPRRPASPVRVHGRWETHISKDGVMVHVRWSLPNPNREGAYLFVRHYPNDTWGRHACEREAQEMNERGKLPVLTHAAGQIFWPAFVGDRGAQ